MDGFNAFEKHVNPVLAQLQALARLNGRFVSARGCYLYDDQGGKYLDFISGHGSFNLGHNPPEVVAGIVRELQNDLPQVYGFGPSPYMGTLARKLVRLAGEPFEIAHFTNSGTEAVEGALKTARAATGRAEIVYCRQAYHGVTLGSLSMMGSGPWRDPYEPLMPGFLPIPFDDPAALENVLKTNACAAFVVEPIQAEAGVCLPREDYLIRAGELCRKYNTLFILDEVQTGLGRTGSLFAFQQMGVVPDIFILAKSLGGGILPMGAFVTTRPVYDRAYGTYERCTALHPTFGGNSLACRAALISVSMLSSQAFMEKVLSNGRYLLDTLREKCEPHRLIRNVRGRGLLVGIEFEADDHPWLSWENMGLEAFSGRNSLPMLVVKHLFKNRVIAEVCGHNWNVLKLEPSLTVGKNEIDGFIAAFSEALEWIDALS